MEPATRRRLLVAAGGLGAAAGAVALVAGGDGDGDGQSDRGAAPAVGRGNTARSTDRFGLGDVGICNFLITVERVEAALYARAVSDGALSGRAEELFRRFAAEERSHVASLVRTVHALGSHTVRPPRVRIPGGDQRALVRYAAALENVAASAFLGQLGSIDTERLLTVALSIHPVDARHAAALAVLAGLDPAPDGAQAQPADAASVLTQLRPLLTG